MDNPETLATSGTQNTGRRQAKCKIKKNNTENFGDTKGVSRSHKSKEGQ
jgi:hypothetical protein